MTTKSKGIPQYSELLVCYDTVLQSPVFLVNECPHDKFLKYVRDKVCAAGTDKWLDLGIELMEQDDVHELNVIKANNSNNVECCSRMFTLWRQRTPKANWKQLIEALKEVKLTQLASELEGLLKPSVECCVEKANIISQKSDIQELPLMELEGTICFMHSM